MSWRFAADRLALPEKEHKSMIKCLNTTITSAIQGCLDRAAAPDQTTTM